MASLQKHNSKWFDHFIGQCASDEVEASKCPKEVEMDHTLRCHEEYMKVGHTG